MYLLIMLHQQQRQAVTQQAQARERRNNRRNQREQAPTLPPEIQKSIAKEDILPSTSYALGFKEVSNRCYTSLLPDLRQLAKCYSSLLSQSSKVQHQQVYTICVPIKSYLNFKINTSASQSPQGTERNWKRPLGPNGTSHSLQGP